MIFPNSTEWGINFESDYPSPDDDLHSDEDVEELKAYLMEKRIDREDSGMAGTA